MRKYIKAAAFLLMLPLVLAGCGAKEPPETYTVGESGEDTVPSLNVLVPTEEVQWSTEEGEDGTTSYQYTDLTSGAETAQTYTKVLEDVYDFTALSQDGKEFLEEPDFPRSREISCWLRRASREAAFFRWLCPGGRPPVR